MALIRRMISSSVLPLSYICERCQREKDAIQRQFENKDLDAEVAVHASRSLGKRAVELALIIQQGGASLKEFLSEDPSYGPFLKKC